MGIRKIDDLIAFKVAREFKREVYALARASPGASGDSRFNSQLVSAASGVEANISEGFHRFSAGEFRQFIRYALASLAEADLRLKDGEDRSYFRPAQCAAAHQAAERCRALLISLFNSLEPFTASSPKPPRP